MITLFSNTYKLWHIPKNKNTQNTTPSQNENTQNTTPSENKNTQNTTPPKKDKTWYSSYLRNYKLTQIKIKQNLIENYETADELTKNMEEYKSFDLNQLYARLIFSTNKSKAISLDHVFFYYKIDVKTKEDKYTLNTFDSYNKDLQTLQTLQKNEKDIDIAELLKSQSSNTSNVYYVYMYDIINNKKIYEFNTTKIDDLHYTNQRENEITESIENTKKNESSENTEPPTNYDEIDEIDQEYLVGGIKKKKNIQTNHRSTFRSKNKTIRTLRKNSKKTLRKLRK